MFRRFTSRNDIIISLRYAFSLIELSIVLIIIGLLVAGVTGGKSLIESAKQRAFINELNGWKRAVYTFYASQGRLPGDLNNDGIIGTCYGTNCPLAENFTASSFSYPYNVNIPHSSIAPVIDLYLEKLLDYKLDPISVNLISSFPKFKTYKGIDDYRI